MHALVVRVTIHDLDRTREVLNSQVVPGVSGAPGFKTGYWTWSTGGGPQNGLSMIIFDSEENARTAAIGSAQSRLRDRTTSPSTASRSGRSSHRPDDGVSCPWQQNRPERAASRP
jgi:hypothetical protein